MGRPTETMGFNPVTLRLDPPDYSTIYRPNFKPASETIALPESLGTPASIEAVQENVAILKQSPTKAVSGAAKVLRGVGRVFATIIGAPIYGAALLAALAIGISCLPVVLALGATAIAAVIAGGIVGGIFGAAIGPFVKEKPEVNTETKNLKKVGAAQGAVIGAGFGAIGSAVATVGLPAIVMAIGFGIPTEIISRIGRAAAHPLAFGLGVNRDTLEGPMKEFSPIETFKAAKEKKAEKKAEATRKEEAVARVQRPFFPGRTQSSRIS